MHLEVSIPDNATGLARKLIEDSAWLSGWRLNAPESRKLNHDKL